MEDEIKELFAQGYDCGQVVLAHFAERYGMKKEAAYRVAAGFGGGMYAGDTCGAVTGAFMAIGLKHGQTEPGEIKKKVAVQAACQQFRSRFMDQKGSCQCKELLGCDISQPGVKEEIMANGRMMEVCPGAVAEAIHILEEILE